METRDEFLVALVSWHSLIACVLLIATAIGAFFWIRSMVRSALGTQIDALKKVADDLHSHSTNVDAKAESVATAADTLNAATTTALANFQTIRDAVEGTFGTALTRLGQSMQPRQTAAELQSQRAHELRVEGVGATAELTKAGFQALLVINGGAIVAVLTLLGTVWSADDAATHALLLPVGIAAFVFALGLVCAVVGIGQAFNAQIEMQKNRPEDDDRPPAGKPDTKTPPSPLKILRRKSYLWGVGSLVFFAVAAAIAIAGFAFADATLELTCPEDGTSDCAIVCRDGTAIGISRGDSVAVRTLANGLSIAISGSETRTELLAPAPDETCRFVDFAEPHWMTRWPWT